MPRRKTELTAEEIAELETLAAVLNQEQISDYFGIPARTFRAIKQRDENVSAAYKRGVARAIATVGTGLLSQAHSGSLGASIFYLKTKGGWSEAVPEPQELPPVVIQLAPDDSD
tara:strand:+ start:327 stop:668 length:342 start_codon:yes stop_codon:yes gene_type:complete